MESQSESKALSEGVLTAADRLESAVTQFDVAEAMDRACGDLDLLTELADLFAENRARLLVELAQGVERGNARRVSEAAHALKGSIGTFSTKRPFHLARDLELCGKEGNLAEAPPILDALKGALEELEASVRGFLSSQRGEASHTGP